MTGNRRGMIMVKAIRVYRTGGPEVLKHEEIELAEPGRGEIRVKHEAIGVNYIDTYFRSGLYPSPDALHPRQRGGGRRHRGRQGRDGLQDRRPGRLCGGTSQLRRGGECAGGSRGEIAEGHFLRDGGRDDAQGDDGGISPSPHLQGAQGRHDPRACGGRRRRPDLVPMGQRRSARR